MAIYSGELLQIYNGTGSTITYNGKNYTNGSYVTLGKQTGYTVQYCKLWSSDTGRSMTGENKGTLIGIFPKITVKLGKLSEDEMHLSFADWGAVCVQYIPHLLPIFEVWMK